ncbi:hypothetical protein DFH01_04085 [Falsiroseomonas bella]|uniref:SPW repeat-containing integral membrane domain-containing protein n=1 Tax=Falsiroseomonas bella TaxID=2184016 RepID=A0A317FKI8_9PROT|nr:SPW repeat protein [Falsiroseomonas bella]PWS38469.1 hypothetical protein DFH01_04085 [Falsiroseomonas bella]
MRFISTRAHGALDYLTAALLILLPYILGFADGGAAQWVPQALGVALILYALFTDYEYAAMRIIPMRVHLFLDIASGLLLAISPWLFGFAEWVFWPHLIVGLFEIGAALFTRTVPSTVAHGVADKYHEF